MNLKRTTQEIIGSPYRDALFYNFPGGLRFELSEGGGSPLGEVLTALRKATAICDDVFRKEERILVHLETFALVSRFELREKLRELRVAGIVIPNIRDVWVEAQAQTDEDDDDESGYWVSCAFEVPTSKLQNLLWCALTVDFGSSVGPNPRCRVYLLNMNDGIVVHPYDDRGMDVIGRNMPSLAGLYECHKDLLLANDLEVMRRTFTRA